MPVTLQHCVGLSAVLLCRRRDGDLRLIWLLGVTLPENFHAWPTGLGRTRPCVGGVHRGALAHYTWLSPYPATRQPLASCVLARPPHRHPTHTWSPLATHPHCMPCCMCPGWHACCSECRWASRTVGAVRVASGCSGNACMSKGGPASSDLLLAPVPQLLEHFGIRQTTGGWCRW